MSVKLMAQTWQDKNPALKDGKLMVLVILSDYANDDGICWPSLPTIAEKAKLTDRQVSRIVAWLVENGYVHVVSKGNGRKSTVYRVTPQRQEDVIPGMTPMSSLGGHSYVTPGMTPMSPDPLIEPLIEPPVIVRKRTARPKSDAVNVFREITRRYPNALAEGAIDLKVTDLEKWGEVVKTWMLRGFSPVNVKGMLEWYEKGIPNYAKKIHETERERTLKEWRDKDE